MRSQHAKAHSTWAATKSRQMVSPYSLPLTSSIDTSLLPAEIVELVKRGPVNLSPFRPLTTDCTFDDLNSIMTRCWKEDPNERPDFGILKTIVRKVNK